MFKKALLILILLAIPAFIFWGLQTPEGVEEKNVITQITEKISSTPTPKPIVAPDSHIMQGGSHNFQTFNNCGPSSLSMALSFYGITKTQQELGQALRPWQNTAGDNDDKSVTLEELAREAEKYGFITYHRPNADLKTIKSFISRDIPVIARTLLEEGNDIGHYRVLYGYDKENFYQNDSLQGKGLVFTYENMFNLWKPYGYEYLVLVPKEKEKLAVQILGENIDYDKAWQNAVSNLEEAVAENPDDIYLKLSLSVAYYNTGQYEKSVDVFENIESQLPWRTLWYQIEPLLAYQKLRRFEPLLSRIQSVLDRHNRAFSELYQIRGEVYEAQGKPELAQEQYDLALYYNKNFVKYWK